MKTHFVNEAVLLKLFVKSLGMSYVQDMEK